MEKSWQYCYAHLQGGSAYFIPPMSLSIILYHVVGDLKRKLHWDEDEEKERKIKWIDREKESIDRLVSIVDGSLQGTFGMGKQRGLDDFKYISGIDL